MTKRVIQLPRWYRIMCSVPTLGLVPLCVLGGLADGGWVLVLGVAGAVAVVAVVWRNWRLRVELDTEVTVVNWLRTVRVPWSEVARFGCDYGSCWLRRRDGREHSLSAFSITGTAPAFIRRLADEAVAQLESARKKRRRSGRARSRR